MSKLEVDAIEPQSGTTLTLGASGDAVNIASGASITDFTSTGIDDNATSTAITIDSSENVIINSGSLSLVGTNTKMSASSDGNDIKFSFNGTDKARLNNNGLFSSGDGSAVVPGFRFFDDADTGMFRPSNNNIAFSTNAAERMRITSGGDIRMAMENYANDSSSTNYGFTLQQNGDAPFINHATNGTGLTTRIAFINDNGSVGSISTNGSATAFNTSSDYRLKENVSYDFDATSRLKQLKPARFNFIADANTTVDGFLAHEVQNIVPEAITGTKDAVQVWEEGEELPEGVSVGDNKLDGEGNTIPVYQGIDQSKLVPLLVKTIQELEARITALENA